MGVVAFFVGVVALLALVSLIWKIAFGLLIPIVFWMLAGMIAGRLLRGKGYGLIADIALGFVGGLVGSIVLNLLGLGGLGSIWVVGNIIVGVIGALVVVYAVRLFGNKDFGK
jgi:uncharacterized membrane protein YeaQ/YmgE (transglycosylase-associated protein family)